MKFKFYLQNNNGETKSLGNADLKTDDPRGTALQIMEQWTRNIVYYGSKVCCQVSSKTHKYILFIDTITGNIDTV